MTQLSARQGKAPDKQFINTHSPIFAATVGVRLSPVREIRRVLREKNAMIRDGVAVMIPLIGNLRQRIMDELGQASLSWNEQNIRRSMDAIARMIGSAGDQARVTLGRLLDQAWDRGIELVDAPLSAERTQPLVSPFSKGESPSNSPLPPLNLRGGMSVPPLKVRGGEEGLRAASGEIDVGGYHVSQSVLDALKDYSSDYLDNALGDAWRKVKAELNLGILGTKTAQQVADAIGRNLDDPSIFHSIALRAEAITQTEMGRVFSRASQLRMAEEAQYVPGLEKQWVHAGHPKEARPGHLAAHGQHVPVDKPFSIGGVKTMHPRAETMPISEVIHCGCDMIPWKKEWMESGDEDLLSMPSQVMRIQPGKAGPAITGIVQDGIDMVDQVMQVELPQIDVKLVKLQGAEGAFVRLVDDLTGQPIGAEIRINPVADFSQKYNVIHEFGHYIDSYILGENWQPGTETGHLEGFISAARHTRKFRDLLVLKAKYQGTPQEQYIDYLMKPSEMFARAYAQYITIRAGESMDEFRLLAETILQMEGADIDFVPMQWEDDDFSGISQVLDALFRSMGWMS